MNVGVPGAINRGRSSAFTFMFGRVSGSVRYDSLRQSQRVLERMAPLVRLGLFAIGVSVFLDQVRGLVSDAQFTWGERRVMGIVALVTIGGFGLAGWVAGRLLKASADLIEVLIAGAESAGRTADLIEVSLVPTLGRIAAALERGHPVAAATPAGDAGPSAAVVEDLRSQLEAFRRADVPERVIECRDALTEHLRGEALHQLDQQVVRWLVSRVQARARAATLAGAAAAAALAARVAESFGDTPEGASLRAALPGLRRKAGLCPRCARPNPGDAAFCPRCAGAAATASQAPLPRSGAPGREDML
jgi:hypothetical protein